MRRAAAFIAGAVVTLFLSIALAAAEDKAVSGKTTAVSADSITVDVNGQAMTFSVNTATKVVARGAGSKARQTQRMTGESPKLIDLVKVGDNVEVTYTESGGTMLATTIRGVGAPAAASPRATKTLEGVVSEASGARLTVKPASGEAVTFVVDADARFTGRGLGTMTKEREAKGAKLTLSDAVAVGDTVEVSYKAMGETKHATGVRVIKKGT